MKIAFLLGGPDISGGTYVIFQHALKCLEMGNKVTVITNEKVTKERIKWHSEAHKLTFKNYKAVAKEQFDVVIATWYRTVYELPKIKAKSYLYFVQSIESRFYPEEYIKWLVDATYTLPLSIITEATWIKDYLKEHYGLDAILVKNGIRKDVYTKDGDRYNKKEGSFRVLVEGPVDIFYKNIPKTIELVRKSKADEIWLLTSSKIDKYAGVDRVFSNQPINECAKIYRSCDVIVKLSYVEGMFAPPLEMFHCGGTAIVYDVTGYDEYLKDGYNSLVVKTDDEEKVVEAINKLYDNRELLDNLKKNGYKTACKWPNWDTSSTEFYNAVKEYSKIKIDSHYLNCTINFNLNTFELLNKRPTATTFIKKFLKDKLPFIYKLYKRIRYGKGTD